MLNVCVGFSNVEVLAAPLAGSPKFQFHPVIVPDAVGIVEIELLKLIAAFSHTQENK